MPQFHIEDINQLSMSCQYQCIINPNTQDICGYEALTRFTDPNQNLIPPNVVFDALHEQPEQFASIELIAKQFQIQHAPQNSRLFINLDPHALQPHTQPLMFDLLSRHQDIVVEIIENTCIQDAALSKTLIDELKRFNIPCALDDVGAKHAMLSLEVLSKVDLVKFDKSWLEYDESTSLPQLLSALIQFAKVSGKKTVLEGIETRQQLAFAQSLSVDYVQGFYFQSLFLTPKHNLPLSNALAQQAYIPTANHKIDCNAEPYIHLMKQSS